PTPTPSAPPPPSPYTPLSRSHPPPSTSSSHGPSPTATPTSPPMPRTCTCTTRSTASWALFRTPLGRNEMTVTHHVRVYRSEEELPREQQLAWKIAEVAVDPVEVEPEVVEMI